MSRTGCSRPRPTSCSTAGRGAAADVDAAEAAVTGRLERQLKASSPTMLRELRSALAAGQAAAASGDQVALAAARGQALAALRHGAFDVAVDATTAGQVERARDWLLIRDFRQATRFTRPGVDATTALDQLERGEITAEEAVIGIRKDLLDAYQARLVTYLDEAEQAVERGFDAALAETPRSPQGYWSISSPTYQEQRSPGERKREDANFSALATAAAAGDRRAFRVSRERALEALNGFTAAPFTPEEQVRRANQLTSFLDLVPVEYDHGTDDGRVTIAFEIQESIAFTEGARSAFNDLQSVLQERDPRACKPCSRPWTSSTASTPTPTRVARSLRSTRSKASTTRPATRSTGCSPRSGRSRTPTPTSTWPRSAWTRWRRRSTSGEREQAEQARLSAYAFFEFGPERFLNSLDPQLVAEVEVDLVRRPRQAGPGRADRQRRLGAGDPRHPACAGRGARRGP